MLSEIRQRVAIAIANARSRAHAMGWTIPDVVARRAIGHWSVEFAFGSISARVTIEDSKVEDWHQEQLSEVIWMKVREQVTA